MEEEKKPVHKKASPKAEDDSDEMKKSDAGEDLAEGVEVVDRIEIDVHDEEPSAPAVVVRKPDSSS